MNKIICLFCFVIVAFISNLSADIERRGAFDLGSGSVKLLVADVDTETHQVVKYLYCNDISISFSDDLAKSRNKSFSEAIQLRALDAFTTLMERAKQYHATRFYCIATEAFRIATNGPDFIARISDELQLPIQMLSQQEEGELGFYSAIAHCKADPEKAVVWDIGNGSCQISWKEGDKIQSYKNSLGKTPVKNLIISRVQGKSLDEKSSPNPISEEDFVIVRDLIIELLGNIPEGLQHKLHDPETKVYGIGAVHNSNITRSTGRFTYDLQLVEELIASRLNLDDDMLTSSDGQAVFFVSDLILVSSTLSHFNIPSVMNVKFYDDPKVKTSGNTIGILVNEHFWNPRSFQLCL